MEAAIGGLSADSRLCMLLIDFYLPHRKCYILLIHTSWNKHCVWPFEGVGNGYP